MACAKRLSSTFYSMATFCLFQFLAKVFYFAIARMDLFNLSNHIKSNKEMDQQVIFVVIVNMFKKWQNFKVFRLKFQFHHNILVHILVCVAKIQQACLNVDRRSFHRNKLEVLVGWSFPQNGWFKINTNGLVKWMNNVAFYGGII